MRNYIPTYLETIPSGVDGWPRFLDAEGRRWAEQRAAACLQGAIRSGVFPATAEVANRIFDRSDHSDLPTCLRGVALIDARLAVAHRALLAAGARQVWCPDRSTS